MSLCGELGFVPCADIARNIFVAERGRRCSFRSAKVRQSMSGSGPDLGLIDRANDK